MRRYCFDGRGLAVMAGIVVCLGGLVSCGGGSGAFQFLYGTPFFSVGALSAAAGPSSTGIQSGGGLGATGGGFVDPCDEPRTRKFVRISMRNLSREYIHYFLVLIARVNGETYPEGAVCADDISTYTAFGYTQVAEGQRISFGNYCLEGPLLYYFHQGGRFQGAGGSSNLGSAIGPAQGSTPAYDSFFTSGGANVPVPDDILFHNPGTGEGATLHLSDIQNNPCDVIIASNADSDCEQDAFYYVSQDDRLAGSTGLGFGSGRRVPNDIQGTGCQCGLGADAVQTLAPSGTSSGDAACNQFFRGGRIDYVFVREDTDPAFPQLLWRVTDAVGGRAHDFDPRAGIE